ncbi:MAG: HAMP domain-containing sensor histidine kinase [Bacteroidia bacterium]|nr:HAMP domain-containing sensor histidine kinase [Bacteroidia bacterium]
MRSRSYTPSLIIWLLITILVNEVAGFYVGKEMYTLAVLFFAAGVLCAVQLIIKFRQTNRSISFFFDSIRNEDTTVNFPVNIEDKSLKALNQSMNELNKHIQEIKLENEYKEKYYRALIQQASIGLVVLNEQDEIELINEVICRYAGISSASTNMNLLKIKNKDFYEVLTRIETGESVTFRNNLSGSVQLLLFRATAIKSGDKIVKLISVQDIRQELDEKELESYQKLISILTHEIMNSIAPMTSVSKTLVNFYIKGGAPVKANAIDDSIISTTVQGLKLIEEQGNGLVSFVNSYRRLIRIPEPVFQPFDVDDWMEQLTILFAEQLRSDHIELDIVVEKTLNEIYADKNLINQVVVNLINNAIDALLQIEDQRKILIELSANRDNRVIIKISNNGPAIPAEIQEKIFIPFYTTKENGSGIGLSLSRQIMRSLKGSISVVSNDQEDTVFTLEI